MSENDDHVLKTIERGKIGALYVGIYGDQKSAANREVIRRSTQLAESRPRAKPMSVVFYSAESAHVWR